MGQQWILEGLMSNGWGSKTFKRCTFDLICGHSEACDSNRSVDLLCVTLYTALYVTLLLHKNTVVLLLWSCQDFNFRWGSSGKSPRDYVLSLMRLIVLIAYCDCCISSNWDEEITERKIVLQLWYLQGRVVANYTFQAACIVFLNIVSKNNSSSCCEFSFFSRKVVLFSSHNRHSLLFNLKWSQRRPVCAICEVKYF